MPRDEFTLEEYRNLQTVGRKWIGEADKTSSVWYRSVTYNMILIACNTGMRPAEMKNLRWRDIMPAKDREGREIVVLFVQGKGEPRKLVAPKSGGEYLERIRAISKATEPEDRVFTNIVGTPAKTLYNSLIACVVSMVSGRFAFRRLACTGYLRAMDLAGRANGSWVKTAGLAFAKQRPDTASGVVFIGLRDETGEFRIFIEPDFFEENRAVIQQAKFFGVEGKIQKEGPIIHVMARSIHELSMDGQASRLRVEFHDFH